MEGSHARASLCLMGRARLYVCGCVSVQAKLQQQLHNAEATEQLLQSELVAARQQLQQAQQEVQQVTADAAAAAAAAEAQRQAELQRLQHQLGDEGTSQVGTASVQQQRSSQACDAGCTQHIHYMFRQGSTVMGARLSSSAAARNLERARIWVDGVHRGDYNKASSTVHPGLLGESFTAATLVHSAVAAITRRQMVFLVLHMLQMQAALSQQAAKLEASSAQQLQALTTAHAAELQQLRQSLEAQLQQAQQQHDAALQALRQEHQEALQRQQEVREAELQASTAKARREAEALQAAAAGSQSQLEQHLRWVFVCCSSFA